MLLSDADVGIQPQPTPQIPANPLSPSQTPNLTAKTQPKLLSDADVGIPAQPAWMSGAPVQQPAWMSGAPVQQPQQPSLPPDQQMGMARGLAHEFVSGVPVGGPLALKGLDLANSYISGDTYTNEQQKRLASEGGFEKEHPIASTAAQIGGGVASMLPLGATGIGARLLGLTGSLPAMIGRGALSGAAIGAADAAVRGQLEGLSVLSLVEPYQP
jgi:hypothetical protein